MSQVTRIEEQRARQNVQFAIVNDASGFPHVFLEATRFVPAGSALWTDYGDSYWEGDYHNHVKLIDSRVALAADVSKAHNGGASLGVKFDPPARARPAWLERKSKRGRSSESDGE